MSRGYGVSPRWVYALVRRFDAEGEAGLEPRSRRPHRSPRRPLRPRGGDRRPPQGALDYGPDAGAHTIAYHLSRRDRVEKADSEESRVSDPATLATVGGIVMGLATLVPQSEVAL